MTRHEERLCGVVLDLVRGLTERQAVERMLAAGLVDLRVCERHAIYAEVERLERQGTPRCEALHAAAGTFCCSYEKARSGYYTHIKNRKQ